MHARRESEIQAICATGIDRPPGHFDRSGLRTLKNELYVDAVNTLSRTCWDLSFVASFLDD